MDTEPTKGSSKIARAYMACAVMLLNTICMGVAIEVIFRIAHIAVDYHRDPGSLVLPHFFKSSSSLQASSKDSPEEILGREEHTYNFSPRYQPYEEFRLESFDGKMITVKEDGFRIVPDQPKNPALTIYLLGDSTTAGSGVPNELTVPGILQRLFNTRTHLKVNVYNRGVAGWVTFQEVIYLVEQLKSGHAPTIAVFYGGAGDILRAAQNGIAETTWYHWPLTHFYKGDTELVNLTAGQRQWFRVRFISYLIKKLRKKGLYSGPFIPFIEQPDYNLYSRIYDEYPQLSEERKERLARSVFTCYEEDIRLTRRLSTAYQFTPYFIWQPLLYPSVTHKHLSSEEVGTLQHEPVAYVDLTARVMPYIKKSPDVIDFSDAFDDMDERIFMDGAHVFAIGNERIAKLMFDRLMQSPELKPYLKAAD